MLGKEKLLDKQKRLAEQRDQLKDKLKLISDTVRKGSVTPTSRRDSPPKSLNPKKPLPSVLSHHSANTQTSDASKENRLKLLSTSKGQSSASASETRPTEPIETTSGGSTPRSLKSPAKPSKADTPTTSQENDSVSPPSQKSPVLLSKYKKLGDIESTTSAEEPQKVKRLKRRVKNINERKGMKYFPAGFMADYCKQVGNTPFSLPLKEYSELMYIKAEVENCLRNNTLALDAGLKRFNREAMPEGDQRKTKCFSQISQSLDVNPGDGAITGCYLNNKYLIIVQKHRIHAYCKKDSLKDWVLKDSMIRLHFENSVKEMIVPCILNKKETVVFCEVYLVKDQRTEKCYLKMAQYRFFSENGKVMKDFLLGSFDCELEKFKSCFINRRACTIAVSAWAKNQARSIAWIFTHALLTDTLRCTPMIPVKHELVSLHDISIATSKTMLLGFGTKSFTVWNGKTGERFLFVNLMKLGPVKSIKCYYGVFAVIQKGFLFLIVSVKDKLHMVAVNMGTGLFKSLRQFNLPKGHICLEAIVKDDKLIGITNKSIICWSLYNSFKLQQLKMEEGDTAYMMKRKMLIMSSDRFKRILYMKSVDDMRKQRGVPVSPPNDTTKEESGDELSNNTEIEELEEKVHDYTE